MFDRLSSAQAQPPAVEVDGEICYDAWVHGVMTNIDRAVL